MFQEQLKKLLQKAYLMKTDISGRLLVPVNSAEKAQLEGVLADCDRSIMALESKLQAGALEEPLLVPKANSQLNWLENQLANLDSYHSQTINSQKSPVQRRLRVFLCHAEADLKQVLNLRQQLEAQNIETWIAEENLLPGQHTDALISNKVKESDIILVCLSQNAVTQPGHHHRQLEIALQVASHQPEGTIYIIPALLSSCELPLRLQQLRSVNLYEETGYRVLFKAFKRRMDDLQLKENFNANAVPPLVPPFGDAPPVRPYAPPPQPSLAQLLEQFERAEKAQNWERIIHLGRTIIQLHPEYTTVRSRVANSYRQRGLLLVRNGDFEKALTHFDEAIHLNPGSAFAYIDQGITYYRMGKYIQAIESFNEAARLDPKYSPIYVNRANAYRHLGEYRKAIADFDAAIRLDTKNSKAYYNRGLTHKLKGDKEAARRDFQQAATLGNEDAQQQLKQL